MSSRKSPKSQRKCSKEAKQWDAAHKVSGTNDEVSRLFTDDDPVTTVKGCGFKNAEVARRTIWLTSQPGSTHKQYWSIRAMAERAQRHPAINNSGNQGMRDAIQVLQAWLDERSSKASKFSDKEKELHEAEKAQRIYLTKTRANAHAKRNCSSEAEFSNHTKEDRKQAIQILKDNAAYTGKEFPLPATHFIAIFGGPGEHGYGSHVCLAAQKKNLPSFRCVSNFKDGAHGVEVVDAKVELQKSISPAASGSFSRNIEVLNLGKRFPLRTFRLHYNCATQKAKFVISSAVSDNAQAAAPSSACVSQTEKALKQRVLTDFFTFKRKQDSESPGPSAKKMKK